MTKQLSQVVAEAQVVPITTQALAEAVAEAVEFLEVAEAHHITTEAQEKMVKLVEAPFLVGRTVQAVVEPQEA